MPESVSKDHALEMLTQVTETAKKARDTGQDMRQVRELIWKSRAAFDVGSYETSVKLSARARVMLAAAQMAAAQVRGEDPETKVAGSDHRHWPSALLTLGTMILIWSLVEFGLTYPGYSELRNQYDSFSCAPGLPNQACLDAQETMSQALARMEVVLAIRIGFAIVGGVIMIAGWMNRLSIESPR